MRRDLGRYGLMVQVAQYETKGASRGPAAAFNGVASIRIILLFEAAEEGEGEAVIEQGH
jgi:hypothetical protein